MRVETIADQLFYSTVLVSCQDDKSDSSWTGTGFLFGYRQNNKLIRFLVSNKHVFKDATRISMRINKGTSAPAGESFELELPTNFWGHPDSNVDVAVIDINEEFCNSKESCFCRFISKDIIPTEKQLQNLDSLEDITFFGCPNGLYDEVNCLPIARTGVTVTPPMVDYKGRSVFLIDASVFPGSSGSPVFILNSGSYCAGNSICLGNRIYFLGVLAASEVQPSLYDTFSVPTSSKLKTAVAQYIDLGIVYKARTVIETIENYLNSRTPS